MIGAIAPRQMLMARCSMPPSAASTKTPRPSPAVLVNFAHPVTPEQLVGLRAETGIWVAEVIKVDVHFDDDRGFAEQISEIVDAAGLSEDDWQTLPLIVNVPAFAYIAAGLIAEVHGRAGHFPSILRLRRAPEDNTRFLFAELLKLQDIRNQARQRR
ncbi:CRISPR-associated protein Csx15 [uncultured Thiohalocapsa sp.]|uniref:CRISPR-associated protein Csx15 n=1 Tax=uncultured Thiohalocapsa sp. TaxID=768990 RepID=UPI0025E04D1A|nr:CRISPR-associated protein Csx15 [uncultured Thiohalocapsa sp.]